MSKYELLQNGKCPTVGCKTNGRKTLLELDEYSKNYKCPKCQCEWAYVIYDIMYPSWRQVKKPLKRKDDQCHT